MVQARIINIDAVTQLPIAPHRVICATYNARCFAPGKVKTVHCATKPNDLRTVQPHMRSHLIVGKNDDRATSHNYASLVRLDSP